MNKENRLIFQDFEASPFGDLTLDTALGGLGEKKEKVDPKKEFKENRDRLEKALRKLEKHAASITKAIKKAGTQIDFESEDGSSLNDRYNSLMQGLNKRLEIDGYPMLSFNEETGALTMLSDQDLEIITDFNEKMKTVDKTLAEFGALAQEARGAALEVASKK